MVEYESLVLALDARSVEQGFRQASAAGAAFTTTTRGAAASVDDLQAKVRQLAEEQEQLNEAARVSGGFADQTVRYREVTRELESTRSTLRAVAQAQADASLGAQKHERSLLSLDGITARVQQKFTALGKAAIGFATADVIARVIGFNSAMDLLSKTSEAVANQIREGLGLDVIAARLEREKKAAEDAAKAWETLADARARAGQVAGRYQVPAYRAEIGNKGGYGYSDDFAQVAGTSVDLGALQGPFLESALRRLESLQEEYKRITEFAPGFGLGTANRLRAETEVSAQLLAAREQALRDVQITVDLNDKLTREYEAQAIMAERVGAALDEAFNSQQELLRATEELRRIGGGASDQSGSGGVYGPGVPYRGGGLGERATVAALSQIGEYSVLIAKIVTEAARLNALNLEQREFVVPEQERGLYSYLGDERRARDRLYGRGLSDADITAGKGPGESLADYEQRLAEADKNMNRLVLSTERWGAATADAVDAMIFGGASAKEAFAQLVLQIERAIVQAAVLKLVQFAIIPAAKGEVFQGGEVVPFAYGGVLAQPTYFPLAGNKVGLAGEAGPEAVVPLKRGADGKLGIGSSGATRSVTVVQNFYGPADQSAMRLSARQTYADLRRLGA